MWSEVIYQEIHIASYNDFLKRFFIINTLQYYKNVAFVTYQYYYIIFIVVETPHLVR